MSRVDCTPISRSIPFVLAPSSRPRSPATHSTFQETVSLLSARIIDLDQERRRLGPDHLGTWYAGLGALESTIVKGSLEGRSPWAPPLEGSAEEGAIDDLDLLRGIPMNMNEWQKWETEKKERKAREKLSQVRPQVLKRRKTAETFIVGEEKKGGAKQVKEQGKREEEEKVDSRRSTTTINTIKPTKQKDGKINLSFTTSKSSKSTAIKPGHPLSTPRQTPDSAKSRSFPSLDTLNSAARSPSPVGISTTSRGLGESWRSGEGGNEEEVLFEVGYSQTILPTSTQNPTSSHPRSNPSKKQQHFLSSPMSLPLQGKDSATNAYTSTPYYRRLDDLSMESNAKTATDKRKVSPQSQSSSSKSAVATVPKAKLHRLSSVGRLGSTYSLKGDAEEEGREIEDFLGREQESLE